MPVHDVDAAPCGPFVEFSAIEGVPRSGGIGFFGTIRVIRELGIPVDGSGIVEAEAERREREARKKAERKAAEEKRREQLIKECKLEIAQIKVKIADYNNWYNRSKDDYPKRCLEDEKEKLVKAELKLAKLEAGQI